jgi:hypothetical protein
MQKNILLILLSIIIVISCQKQASVASHDGADAPVLLVKSIFNVNDSSTHLSSNTATEYEYDIGRKLISRSLRTVSVANGVRYEYSSYKHFYRDKNGRIMKVTEKYGEPREGVTYDTIVTNVHYENEGSTNLLSTVRSVKQTGSQVAKYDSTVYFYNNHERVSKTNNYTYSSNSMQPHLSNYYTWQYDALGNLLEMKLYSDVDYYGNYNGGNFFLNSTFLFEYDHHPAPFYHADEDRLTNGQWPTTPNNVITSRTQYNGREDVIVYRYQYRDDGRPASVGYRDAPGSTVYLYR